MKIICFGDSNTYGCDPRSYFGSRYSADCRWVDILAAETGWDVANEGMNGREIPRRATAFPENTDLLIVMLGTNDLLQGRSPDEAAKQMTAFLSALSIQRSGILLIAPPPMQPGEWVPDQDLIRASKQLPEYYRILAEHLGVRFADAGEWEISVTFDGVHFTEEGHKAFSKGLLKTLAET